MKKTYTAPSAITIGSFQKSTKGVWFGACRDIFGGRAFICIG